MKDKFTIFLFFIFIFFGTTAYGATFKGKVIDADTKEPIEGAVVVAVWYEETTTVGATHTEVKDVKETLTNKKGEWIIKGPKGREMGDITAIFTLITGTYITIPPQFIVFKPEYCSYPAGFGIDACKKNIKTYNPTNSETIGEIVELPKLTNRERMTMIRNIPSLGMASEAKDKLPLFTELVEQEERKIPWR